METGDKNLNPFLNTGDVDYIAKLQSIDTALNKWIDEAVAAQVGEVDLVTRLARAWFLGEAGAGNLDGGGFRITNVGDAIGTTDYTTLQQVNALIIGGGSPGDIDITALDVGTATANQKIVINGAGTAVVGADDISPTWTVITSGTTAESFKKYIANMTASSYTIFMPLSPSVGDEIWINKYGDFQLLVNGNGNDIQNSPDVATVNTVGKFSLVYMDATNGWIRS